MQEIFTRLKSIRKRCGSAAVSYALLAGLIAVGVISSITNLGENVSAVLGLAKDEIDTTVNDGGSPNSLPTISDISDASILVDEVYGPVNFSVSDIETANTLLALSATSSNATLVQDGNIAIGGTGGARTITIMPEAGQIGETVITVTVDDGQDTASDNFTLLVLEEEVKLLGDNGNAHDWFGFSVDMSGDTIVIGAPIDDDMGLNYGSSVIFTRSGGGWVQQAEIYDINGASSDDFGYSVAIHGNTVLVGARNDDDLGDQSGSAFVFTRSGSSWSLEGQLTAGDGDSNTLFGHAVDLYEDTAVISAYADDDIASNAGSVYVFVRSGSIWSQQAKLISSDLEAGDEFGQSVTIDTDTLLVGAKGDNFLSSTNSGAAYVFTRSGINWSEAAKLTASDRADNDWFGWSVALDNGTAAIGARKATGNGAGTGAVYIFTGGGNSWAEQEKFFASDGETTDEFGFSVSIDGDTVMVGAYGDDDLGSSAGAAYVFTRSGSSWSQNSKITASDGASPALFGHSVSLENGTAVIGARSEDELGNTAGAAYVFEGL